MTVRCIALFFAVLVLSTPVHAGNVTLHHEFDGTENEMPINQASDAGTCGFEPPGMLPYVNMGNFAVSQTGEHRVADFHIGWLTGSQTRSVDTVLLIYHNAFDPANPAQNLVAVFDYGEWNRINNQPWAWLDSTQNYVAVLQLTCAKVIGVGGFIMRGPGNIAEIGFDTPHQFYGDFALVSNTNLADFGEWGTHLYANPYLYTAKRSGAHWFFDMSAGIGGGEARPFVYSAPFNPADPSANLLSVPDWWLMQVYLEEGQQIYVVVVDIFDSLSPYQGIIHAPGELLGINPFFAGTWLDPTRAAQGFLMDLDETFGILFAALFTFNTAPAVTESSGAGAQKLVGSSDQRWLTAFGSFSTDSTEVNLKFENTTGGAFNAELPKPTTDSSYGTGKLIAKDCKHIDIEYDLPEAQGVFTLTRGLQAFIQECAAELPVAAPEPLE